MSRRVTRTNRTPRKKKSSVWIHLLRLWPLVLAILLTPLAVRSASVLALNGPSAVRLLYPWLVLLQSQTQHFSDYQAETLSQWILYGQFPVYAGVWLLAGRLVGATAGPLSALLLHGAGVAAAILTAGS